MLRADYRIVLSQRDLSSWLFLLHTWPLFSSSSIKRCAVEAWFCEETGTRGLISVAWRRGEESEGIYFFYFFPFLALHHTSWMCVKAGRYTALWWTECEKWARKNAQSDGRITKQKMFLCWYSKSLTTSTCETTSSDEKMIYYFTEKRQLSPINSKGNIKREHFLKTVAVSFLRANLLCWPVFQRKKW